MSLAIWHSSLVVLGIVIVLFLFFWQFFSFCRHPDGEPEANFSHAGQDKFSMLAATLATGKPHRRFAGVSAYELLYAECR
ncbi:hypothetical protein [Candidatus Thiosymbion oneisti]|uniref:hypothetical protein n=1 Tax=Candidatus Thiosymbion oneisti TaxID=589554 RepID=UPI00105ED44D|nr:hypothetical protein [Candidatus Thiosymbion oneisti]